MDFSGLIAGLGNPGARYEGTRHNCGFMFVDSLLTIAEEDGTVERINGKKFNSQLWKIHIPQLKGSWLITKPQTFMNDSGAAIQPLLCWYKLSPAKLIVIQDELDLPPGEIRFKYGGGLAGHNGLSSIAQILGTRDFYRLRIGIGKPIHKSDMLDWVLGRPDASDMEKIEAVMPEALETIFIFNNEGFKPAMLYARKVSA